MTRRPAVSCAPKTCAGIYEWFDSLTDPELRIITGWLCSKRQAYWSDYPNPTIGVSRRRRVLAISERIHAAHDITPLNVSRDPIGADATIANGRVTFAVATLSRILSNCLNWRGNRYALLRRYSGPADVHMGELVALVDYSRTHPEADELLTALMSTWPDPLDALLLCVDQLQLA